MNGMNQIFKGDIYEELRQNSRKATAMIFRVREENDMSHFRYFNLLY
jgi:hypothetical protein